MGLRSRRDPSCRGNQEETTAATSTKNAPLDAYHRKRAVGFLLDDRSTVVYIANLACMRAIVAPYSVRAVPGATVSTLLQERPDVTQAVTWLADVVSGATGRPA